MYDTFTHMVPPVPQGFHHVEGNLTTGFVIENDETHSQYTWVPVGLIKPNGRWDGSKARFGQRLTPKDKLREFDRIQEHTYFNEMGVPRKEAFHVTGQYIDPNMRQALKSVNRYGGFYISRYPISEDSNGKLLSVAGATPVSDVTFSEAVNMAARVEKTQHVTSHLIFGAEFDTAIEWLYESSKLLHNEVDGRIHPTKCYFEKFSRTGTSEVLHIADIRRSIRTWSQEVFHQTKGEFAKWDGHVTRGQSSKRYYKPLMRRKAIYLGSAREDDIGIRVCLTIE